MKMTIFLFQLCPLILSSNLSVKCFTRIRRRGPSSKRSTPDWRRVNSVIFLENETVGHVLNELKLSRMWQAAMLRTQQKRPRSLLQFSSVQSQIGVRIGRRKRIDVVRQSLDSVQSMEQKVHPALEWWKTAHWILVDGMERKSNEWMYCPRHQRDHCRCADAN